MPGIQNIFIGLRGNGKSFSAGGDLNWMRRMIRVRRQHPTFGRGSIEFLHPKNRKVLAFIRKHEGEDILVVANLARSVQPVELDLFAYNGFTPVEMLGLTEFPRIGDLPYFLTPGPYSFYWFQLQRTPAPIAVRVARGDTHAETVLLVKREKLRLHALRVELDNFKPLKFPAMFQTINLLEKISEI